MIRICNQDTMTGGRMSRQCVETFNRGSYTDLLASAPIDAPENIPCGSVSGTLAKDWMGRPLAYVTTERRA